MRDSSKRLRLSIGEIHQLGWVVTSLALAYGCGGSSTSTNPDPGDSTATGELVVVLRTVGDQVDPDGYTVAIDNAPETELSANGELRVSDVSAGRRSYQIWGIAPNCRLTNREPIGSVSVSPVEAAELKFEVFCLEPDQGRIFYTTLEGSVRSINPLGGDRQILPLSADKVAISRDQQRIVFNWDNDIWVAAVDGSDAVNLTNAPGRAEARPSWSPDGQQIAYMRNEVIGESEFDIFVMNADGSGATNLTPDTPGWTDGEPDWSPDGTRIAFRSHRSSGGDIWTMAPDGSQLVQLTTEGLIDTNPRWSPDGEKVVFTRFMGPRQEGGTDFELFVIGADGTGLRQLTSDNFIDESHRTSEADWSPDGQWMVFASRNFDSTPSVFDLYMMRSDGTDRIQITFGERAGLPFWVP